MNIIHARRLKALHETAASAIQCAMVAKTKEEFVKYETLYVETQCEILKMFLKLPKETTKDEERINY